MSDNGTHSKTIGYILWIFGFTGAHRFYFGKRKTGLLWMLTGGFFLVGWLIDLFLIPSMDAEADERYTPGTFDYTIAWILLTFGGLLGLHRFYLGKWATGLLWLCTGGFFLVGWAYDFWTMNEQVQDANRR